MTAKSDALGQTINGFFHANLRTRLVITDNQDLEFLVNLTVSIHDPNFNPGVTKDLPLRWLVVDNHPTIDHPDDVTDIEIGIVCDEIRAEATRRHLTIGA